MPELMHLPMLFVRQKITMRVNRYEILAANPDGSIGGLLGLAQQKRMALKEHITFFEDSERTRGTPVSAASATSWWPSCGASPTSRSCRPTSTSLTPRPGRC